MKIFKIGVVFTLDNGDSVTGEIDVEESFVPDLNRAIGNGKNPINALSLLADIGARNLGLNPIAVKNRIGDFGGDVIKIEAVAIDKFNTITVGNVEELNKRVIDIWNNPGLYYDCQAGDDAYYKFLKFLWIVYPDGSEKRFMDYATSECGVV